MKTSGNTTIIPNYRPVHWDDDTNSWELDARCVYCSGTDGVKNGYHGQPECEGCRSARDEDAAHWQGVEA